MLLLRPIMLVISCLMMIAGLDFVPTAETKQRMDSETLGTMRIHFLDVGQADAALILADGEAILIDGGNVADSSLIVSALRRNGVRHLTAVVGTHAHEDHIGGLAAALKECSADVVYSPVRSYDSDAFRNFAAYAQKRGCALTVPKQGDAFSFGGASVQFLSPVMHYENTNDSSLVLRIAYGAHSFLFMADAERGAELQLLDAGLVSPTTVLKVGHHGSDSSTSYVFLREVMPQYAVISVEKDNSYGFPDEVVLSRLADAGSVVYRTDLCGEITMTTDGMNLSVATERSYDAQAAAVSGAQRTDSIPAYATYVGNLNSEKFHDIDCRSLPSEQNRCYFTSRAEAVQAGYTPCGQCKP